MTDVWTDSDESTTDRLTNRLLPGMANIQACGCPMPRAATLNQMLNVDYLYIITLILSVKLYENQLIHDRKCLSNTTDTT